MAAVIILLIIALVIAIQIPAVQEFAKTKAVNYLHSKINTPVSIGRLSVQFPNNITIEKVYLEDEHKDTLLYGEKIKVDIGLWQLLSNQVSLHSLELEGIQVNVNRTIKDSAFNFDYIIKAFSSDSDTAAVKNTSTNSFSYIIGPILLHNIHATYKDDFTGTDAKISVGNLQAIINALDPEKAKYHINSLTIADVQATIRQYKQLATIVDTSNSVNTNSVKTDMQLGLLQVSNVLCSYINEPSALEANMKLGVFNTRMGKIDINNLYFPVKSLQLNNSDIAIIKGKAAIDSLVQATPVNAAPTATIWHINIDATALHNNFFRYDDQQEKPVTNALDYNHLFLQNVDFVANNLNLSPQGYTGAITNLSFKEKSGFNIRQFNTVFNYNDTAAALNNFYLNTGKSVLKDNIKISYPSIEAIKVSPATLFVDAGISKSIVSVKDILLLAPFLKSQLKGNEQQQFAINSHVKGFVNNLAIQDFELSGMSNTSIAIAGSIKGLPDINKTFFNLQLKQFASGKKDIEAILGKANMPSSFRLPNAMKVNGIFKGTIQSFTTNLQAITSSGNATINATVKNGGKAYDGVIHLKEANLGYLLKQDTLLGKFSLDAVVKGAGTDYKTMHTSLTANLQSGTFKGFTYHDLSLDALLNNGQAIFSSSMQDPSFSYSLNGESNLNGKYPSLHLDLQLDTANLQALHWYNDTLSIHGKLLAQFTSLNPDEPEGTVLINNISITKDKLHIGTDSIYLLAEKNDTANHLYLYTETAKLDLRGKYQLTHTAAALKQAFEQYYNTVSKPDTAAYNDDWRMTMQFNPSPLLLQLVPAIKGTDSIAGTMDFNSRDKILAMQLQAPHVQYNDMYIDQMYGAINSDSNKLTYQFNINKGGTRGFRLYKTEVSGTVADNMINTSLLFKDAVEQDKYHLSAKLSKVASGVLFKLDPENLLLNKKQWTVSKDNYIQVDTNGISASQFELMHQDQNLSINSISSNANAPLEIKFKNFSIATITDIIEQDSLLANGIINGNVILSNATTSPTFTSNITIDNLSYKKDTVGNLLVQVNNDVANIFDANIALTGNDNDITAKGKYFIENNSADMQLNINQFNLSNIPAFSVGQLKDAGGLLKGSIAVKGKIDTPIVNGNVFFENAFITPTLLGERFSLPNEQINIIPQGIHFNEFSLVDTSGNKAIINGDVLTTDFRNYNFAINLLADDFSLVNSTKADNPDFFGNLNLDANIKLGGNTQIPVVDAQIHINKQTDFTFILPGNDPELQSREGVVHFINADDLNDSLQQDLDIDSALHLSSLAGFDFSAIIETDTAALFTLVIDERSGDALTLKGNAHLAAGMDESGKLSLTGNYELEKGAYQLSFNLLKKKFDIQKGSVITWTGDPTSATVDITALYETKAAPIDLVEAQLSGLSPAELNKYKQRIPVKVYLKMKGDLMHPQITFDVALPEPEISRWPLVDNSLEQIRTNESELNKQVFALLLLGRFVGEDITQSSAGSTSTATLLRQSVSGILADQLNKIAGDLISGVDINFGIDAQDDYSSGSQQTSTDLTVGLSKSLFNNRIKISVGSNFALEGASANKDAANIAGDVAIDYLLSKDGRYTLRAYRKNNYEGVLEGQIVESGLTFMLTFDYDHFKELFQAKKEKTNKKNASKNLQ
ncbi:translocation/assembly module TamB domain-containing protein [Limnovirga soli]|uniref:Translocation and assembly module TamB C-terminal domain-containing protein n=1 Tax=Limnovirga soli TaxID=2656915 RepID=A0A8J8JVX0_9BACT|nr:translocation/assembly module TamB domain-containing protein [Limnovirga soli]NNV57109.1 hypothetical protein [Limnovirga soli]